MPAGVGWSQYLKFVACAMASMIAGSQLVHMYYKPLNDLDTYIEKEMQQVKHQQQTTTIVVGTTPHAESTVSAS